MGIELKKGENVFYPAPYVPSEPAFIIVTDQRIVHFGDEGRQEMASAKVSFVGRLQQRPFLWLCIVLVVIGLPILLYAANNWYGLVGDVAAVKDMKTFSEQGITADTAGDAEDPLYTKIKTVALGAFGAALIFVAWRLIKKKRYIVIVRGGDELMKLKVPDEMKQTQIVMTVQAMQQTAKAMKGAAAPAKS